MRATSATSTVGIRLSAAIRAPSISERHLCPVGPSITSTRPALPPFETCKLNVHFTVSWQADTSVQSGGLLACSDQVRPEGLR